MPIRTELGCELDVTVIIATEDRKVRLNEAVVTYVSLNRGEFHFSFGNCPYPQTECGPKDNSQKFTVGGGRKTEKFWSHPGGRKEETFGTQIRREQNRSATELIRVIPLRLDKR